MPNIGEMRSAKSLGYKQSCAYIWLACKGCGKERWVRKREYSKQTFSNLCNLCSIKQKDLKHLEDVRLTSKCEVKSAKELGLKSHMLMYLDTCKGCGKQLWRQKPQIGRYCSTCRSTILQPLRISGDKNPHWKGGRYIAPNGYVSITVPSDSPFYPMANKYNHRISEHRLVIAKHLNRCLESWEVVHHINGIKGDNRIENLELLPSASNHTPYTRMEIRIRELENRVTILEAENALLKAEKEMANEHS